MDRMRALRLLARSGIGRLTMSAPVILLAAACSVPGKTVPTTTKPTGSVSTVAGPVDRSTNLPSAITELSEAELAYLGEVADSAPSFDGPTVPWYVQLAYGRATCSVLSKGYGQETIRELMDKDGLTATEDQAAVLAAAVKHLCPEQAR